jgi:hypothetical protein
VLVVAAGSANCDGSASARPSRVSSMAGDPASATVGRWPRALAAAPVGWPSAGPGGPSWAAIGGTTEGTGTAPRIDLRAPRRSDASACFSAAGGSGQTRMGGMARVLCSCLAGGSSTPPRRRAGGRARLHRRAGGPASAVRAASAAPDAPAAPPARGNSHRSAPSRPMELRHFAPRSWTEREIASSSWLCFTLYERVRTARPSAAPSQPCPPLLPRLRKKTYREGLLETAMSGCCVSRSEEM